MKIAVYDKASGRIAFHMDCPPVVAASQCNDKQEIYLNCPVGATHITPSGPVTLHEKPLMLSRDAALRQIRYERNSRLSVCDWTQIPDCSLDPGQKSMWAIYRQLLRDFPSMCDPFNPVWPEPPK